MIGSFSYAKDRCVIHLFPLLQQHHKNPNHLVKSVTRKFRSVPVANKLPKISPFTRKFRSVPVPKKFRSDPAQNQSFYQNIHTQTSSKTINPIPAKPVSNSHCFLGFLVCGYMNRMIRAVLIFADVRVLLRNWNYHLNSVGF